MELGKRGRNPDPIYGYPSSLPLHLCTDTLWLMGLRDEFKQAQDWVVRDLTFSNARDVSVFETTIRELGGLLSAYDLTRESVFKDKVLTSADRKTLLTRDVMA